MFCEIDPTHTGESKETPRKRKKGEDGAAEPRDPQEARAEALQALRKSYVISQHGIQGTLGEEASFALPASAIRAWRPIEVPSPSNFEAQPSQLNRYWSHI